MSRTKARRVMRGEELQKKMKNQGVVVMAQTFGGLAEENPQAYKNPEEVIAPVVKEGLVKKVASFSPLGVLIG